MKRYEIQVDDLEIEPDAIFDTKTKTLYECRSSDMNELCKLLNKEDTKWQKLKEWLEEQQNNFKLISKTLGKADYVLLSNCIKSVLSEMAKLEGEDVKD